MPKRKKRSKKRTSKKKGPTLEGKQDARSFLVKYIEEKHPYFKSKDLRDTLFPKQKRFLDDPSRFKAALCSRRAGKSRTGAVGMIKAAQKYPGSLIPYIALTRQSAKNIMWPALQEINYLFQLQMNEKESSLEFEVPTKGKPSKIFMIGADMKNFIDRLRGPKYPLAFIDEGGHFGSHIESLVDDVLAPATADYADGQVWICGTPGAVPTGYFYDITTQSNRGFSNHHWTILDNPFFRDAQGFLKAERQRKGWTIESPTYIREWLGEWAYDKSVLVYKTHDYNICSTPLDSTVDWHSVLGVDIGWHDQTSFTLIKYSTERQVVRIVRNEAFSEMIPSEIGDYVKMVMETDRPTNIVMDTGGLGKSIAEELRKRFGIPVKAAEKKDKMANIELFNGDLQRGMIEIDASLEELIHQMNHLQKADNGLEDPSMPNDRCFVAGTWITTTLGPRPIEDIQRGDYVLTRQGFRKVDWAAQTGIARTIELKFSSGEILRCTANHPIANDKGEFIEAGKWKIGDRAWQKSSGLSIKEKNTEDTQTQNVYRTEGISNMDRSTYIESFGKTNSDPSQRGITSTTSDQLTTTALKILNVFLPKSTQTFILRSAGKIKTIAKGLVSTLQKSEKRLLNGTDQKKVDGGIKSTGITQSVNMSAVKSPLNALSAAQKQENQNHRNIQNTAPRNVPLNGEETKELITSTGNASFAQSSIQPTNTQSRSSAPVLVSVKAHSEKTPVFNLRVKSVHEYFANRILVSNCDSTLYAWRECKNYIYQEPEPVLDKNTNAYMEQYWEQYAEKMEADEREDQWNPTLDLLRI